MAEIEEPRVERQSLPDDAGHGRAPRTAHRDHPPQDAETLARQLAEARDTCVWLHRELDVRSGYADFLRERIETLTHERDEQRLSAASLQTELQRLQRALQALRSELQVLQSERDAYEVDRQRLAEIEREFWNRRETLRYLIADRVNAAIKRIPLAHRLARFGLTRLLRRERQP
jgi:chromosome segregation ATPase